MAYNKTSAKQNLMPVIVTIGLVVGILIALCIAGSRELTNTESVLLGILLSSASMLVSWLATHLYSQISLRDTIKQATDSNTESIRSLGVRAAEKVLNLSSELQRLIDAMSTALDDAEEMEGTKLPTMLLRERVMSAIHNLDTLKSMNDTFLSDWRGVIGDEIDRQHALEQQIETLEIELSNQIRERNSLQEDLVSPGDLTAIQSRIAETEHRLTNMIISLPFKVPPKPKKSQKETVTVTCASCESANDIQLRLRKGAKKLVKCKACECYSLVKVIDNDEMDIVPIPMYKYFGECPLCSSDIDKEVANHPGASVSFECYSCGSKLILSKSTEGANLRIPKGYRKQTPQKLVELVLDKLPQQPWPQHVHKTIAKELGISNGAASRAIGKLIESGAFPPNPSHATEPIEPD